MADSASDKARMRIREEMARKHLSQRDVAGILDWSQSRVSKNLNAKIELGLDDLEALCFAVGIRLTEAVRDHGLEFCAEMTPTELRVIEKIRSFTPQKLEAALYMFDMRTATRHEERGATKRKEPWKKAR
jgi:transcriptional regulator with XRE-family HTH domain